MNAENISMKTI